MDTRGGAEVEEISFVISFWFRDFNLFVVCWYIYMSRAEAAAPVKKDILCDGGMVIEGAYYHLLCRTIPTIIYH